MVGSALFAASVNLFIVPFGLYNSGIIGFAQIIRTVLADSFNIKFNFDIAGIINFCLNVKENCATEYSGATPMDDAMERLLRARKGN